jgi:glycosyltransferase involved in cell wall biosynthesis
MTDPLGQSQVLPYLIGLSKKGYLFTLVSCEKKERYQQNKSIIEKICSENNINWQPIFYTKKPPVISTVLDIIKLNKKVKKLYQQNQFLLIHCRSYITSLIGLAFKQKYGVKFIFDMRGFWADERVDGNLWNLKNPLFKWVYKYFKQKERSFLQYADKTVSLTENGKQEMLTWNIPTLTSAKIVVIPCAADYNLFELVTDEKRKLAKEKLGLTNNEFVLSYIGSIGTWYLLDEMLLFFSIFKKDNPAAKFLFLTPDNEEFILNSAKKYNLNSTDFIIKFAQRQEIPTYAHASNFSIFFIKPAYSKKSSSPTKMGELMAMGIPLICNNNVGDVELIMRKTNAGFCLAQLAEETFIETTQQIKSWNLTHPQEIRESSKQFYDLENGGNLYLAIYKELV